MLSWVGKRPLREVRTYPAQLVERFSADGETSASVGWSDWPQEFKRGGLLFHGDNKEVLAYLLATGFRGKVDLIYIDPPFDSGADYVRRIQLRGGSGTARMDGESYTLGEQIQYTDIWANDNYLQFMYERLLLLKELLARTGTLYVHLDWRRVAQLRVILDEVFGPAAFRNEIIWMYRGKGLTGDKGKFPAYHASILSYGAGDNTFFQPIREPGIARSVLDRWGSYLREDGSITFGALRVGNEAAELEKATARFVRANGRVPEDDDVAVIYEAGALYRDVWTDIPVVRENERYSEWRGYPTQKPLALLERVVAASSPNGGLVLDVFAGSGTSAVAAQKLGRRWIGCDINKGAIQTAEKRLLEIMRQTAGNSTGQERLMDDGTPAEPLPAQLSFSVYRVNDYDLRIQHNEAVNLAAEHLGIERLRTDSFFDGIRGRELVKIVPFDHPLTPLDLQTIEEELRARPQEERDILVVALGKELAADAWLAEYAQRSPINKMRVVELRSDPKYGGFFEHRPASARVELDSLADGRAKLIIHDFMSPTILERLKAQEGVLTPHIDGWRAMVDSVMIDTDYDGETFNIVIADMPERKADLVDGVYEFELPAESTAVAVRITDMLGEEVLAVMPTAPSGPRTIVAGS